MDLRKLRVVRQLMELTSGISRALDNGHKVEACVLDFAKAFKKPINENSFPN